MQTSNYCNWKMLKAANLLQKEMYLSHAKQVTSIEEASAKQDPQNDSRLKSCLL